MPSSLGPGGRRRVAVVRIAERLGGSGSVFNSVSKSQSRRRFLGPAAPRLHAPRLISNPSPSMDPLPGKVSPDARA